MSCCCGGKAALAEDTERRAAEASSERRGPEVRRAAEERERKAADERRAAAAEERRDEERRAAAAEERIKAEERRAATAEASSERSRPEVRRAAEERERKAAEERRAAEERERKAAEASSERRGPEVRRAAEVRERKAAEERRAAEERERKTAEERRAEERERRVAKERRVAERDRFPDEEEAPRSDPPFDHSLQRASNINATSTTAVKEDALLNPPPPPEALASHAASSSAEGGLDVKKKIQTGAAVEEENVDVDLDVLIGNISDLLELIKKNSSHQKPSIQYWPITSSGLLKLKDFLSEGIKCTSVREDNITDRYPSFTKTIVRSLMKNIGHTHCVTAGLLVVADILQRFETVSANRNECLSLLEEMNRLAKFLKELKERLPPSEGMENTIDAATELIVEASIMCCTQIDSYKFSSFFSSPINKEELGSFEQQLRKMYKSLVTVVNRRAYPEYAVGIKSSVNEVIDLLEWESQNNAVAVILQGPEGMGKTTLAQAVFSCIDIQESKNAMIKVVEKIDSTPKIIALQKSILNDIMEPEEPIPDIRKYEEGQRELSVMLQRVPAFIFIDNVMCPDDLQLLLPKDMKKAKKLRLLLTTCDINVRRACRIKTKVYAMKSLAESDAKHLLEKEMSDGTERGNQLNDDQLQKLLEICGGVPERLTLVAGIIRCAENKHNAFMKVIEENGERWGEMADIVALYILCCI